MWKIVLSKTLSQEFSQNVLRRTKAATLSSSVTCLFLVPDLVPDHSKLSIAFRFPVHTPSHFPFLLQKSLPQPLQLPIRVSAEILAPRRLRTISKELRVVPFRSSCPPALLPVVRGTQHGCVRNKSSCFEANKFTRLSPIH